MTCPAMLVTSVTNNTSTESLSGKGVSFFLVIMHLTNSIYLCLDLLNHEDFTSNTELRVLD